MTIIQLLNKIKLIKFTNSKDYEKKIQRLLSQYDTQSIIERQLKSLFPSDMSEDDFKRNYTDLSELNKIQSKQLAGDINKSIIDKVIKLRKSGKELEIEDAISKLVKQKQYQIRTLSNTTQIAVSRAVTFKDSSKKQKYKYVGSRFNARIFCLTHLNKIYTLEEIEKLDNNQNLPVKYYCGGYNCRHRWIKVNE